MFNNLQVTIGNVGVFLFGEVEAYYLVATRLKGNLGHLAWINVDWNLTTNDVLVCQIGFVQSYLVLSVSEECLQLINIRFILNNLKVKLRMTLSPFIEINAELEDDEKVILFLSSITILNETCSFKV